MGEVIDDFYDSDAPQFKGKSKEKRRQMAIAAKLQADEERACWKTHKKVGMKMKGGKLVNDCRPKNEAVDLKKKSSERKLNTNPGEKPESAKEYRKNSEPLRKHREKFGDLSKVDEAAPKYDKEGNDKFDRYKRMVRHKQDKYGPSTLKQRLKHGGVDHNIDNERKAKNEDWQSVNRKDKTDGLSQKAVNAYRKENPGSKLKTAVTKKPSELKKGSKDAKRRSSFCSRMKGMKKRLTSAKTARDPDSKINKALRRWNC